MSTSTEILLVGSLRTESNYPVDRSLLEAPAPIPFYFNREFGRALVREGLIRRIRELCLSGGCTDANKIQIFGNFLTFPLTESEPSAFIW